MEYEQRISEMSKDNLTGNELEEIRREKSKDEITKLKFEVEKLEAMVAESNSKASQLDELNSALTFEKMTGIGP